MQSGKFSSRVWVGILVMCLGCSCLVPAQEVILRAENGKQWFKGNTHAHTLWSDGEMAPELLVAWYKDHGYHFLCVSDHNIMNDGTVHRNIPIQENGILTPERVAAIEAEYGTDWVEKRVINGRPYMELKALPALKKHFEGPGEFLLIPGEEITAFVPAVHINGLNLKEFIFPAHEVSVVEAIQFAVDHVAEQSERHGVPMLAHINHPNFESGVRAEDIAAVPAERFFEVYNGHPSVHNAGHEGRQRVSTDRLWDIALALRLSHSPKDVLFGLATDDTHEYYDWKPRNSNAGRGWLMVLSDTLSGDAIVTAMKKGDFYATTGVLLDEVSVNAEQYKVTIRQEPGVTYTTQFIGTLKGFDATATPRMDAEGKELTLVTAKYSEEIGQLLFETTDNPAVYPFTGEELYVRARVVSSKAKDNVRPEGEMERAWSQPAAPKPEK
jgi:hypothetical protein